VRAARFGPGQAVVETLEQPGLKPAGIAGPGQPVQHSRRRGRANHRWTVGMDVRGEERGSAQVIRG
jgi:hypothetical protein